MSELGMMTFEDLQKAVLGSAVAIRSRTRLQPAGGAGDKVFPPTYAVDKGARTKYAFEERVIDGKVQQTVLLDSVASQANRIEEALQAAWDAGNLDFPLIAVDFSSQPGLEDLDRISTLQTPHRIADAILRDSIEVHSKLPFRATEAGKRYTDATVRNATPLFQYCPSALILGVWDSTGPKGGLGAKFQRALVSEIVGFGAEAGVKTASRLDPLSILSSVPVYHRKDDESEWTIEASEAAQKSGKTIPFTRSGGEGKGKPSAINHSNVAPSIETTSGGVTLQYALQTTVLSLPALRKLRFPYDFDGNVVEPERRAAAEESVRLCLAALALAAVVYQRQQGYDLRSRSLLWPQEPFCLEVLPADGGTCQRFGLDTAQAATLLRQAQTMAAQHGFAWQREPLRLEPAPKLAALIRKSRELAAKGEGTEDGGA